MTLVSNWTFLTTANNVCVRNMDATLRAHTRTASMLACTRIIWAAGACDTGSVHGSGFQWFVISKPGGENGARRKAFDTDDDHDSRRL